MPFNPMFLAGFQSFNYESYHYSHSVLQPQVQEQHIDLFLVIPVLKMGFCGKQLYGITLEVANLIFTDFQQLNLLFLEVGIAFLFYAWVQYNPEPRLGILSIMLI